MHIRDSPDLIKRLDFLKKSFDERSRTKTMELAVMLTSSLLGYSSYSKAEMNKTIEFIRLFDQNRFQAMNQIIEAEKELLTTHNIQKGNKS